jgi:hypothetical protein
MGHELRGAQGSFPSVEDRMNAMINASVSHNNRRTVLDGMRQAPVNHKGGCSKELMHPIVSLRPGAPDGV